MPHRPRLFVVLAACALLGCSKPKQAQHTFSLDVGQATPSASELLGQAESAHSPEERLALLHRIVSTYPDSPQAPVAQFMVGSILLEELKRPEEAREAFQALRERYPSSEWIDDADKLLDSAPPRVPDSLSLQ